MNRSFLTRSLRAQIVCGFFMAVATLALTSCHSSNYYQYKFPEFTFANRPVPPSKLANRVLVAVSTNGSSGTLPILDGLRDIRSNIENTIPSFAISGSVGTVPSLLLNFPSEVHGYVYSTGSDGALSLINYSTETATSSGSSFVGATSIATPPQGGHIYATVPTTGQLIIVDSTSTAGTYPLNIPNVFSVAVNTGDTVVLAMVRNSNVVYRVIKLNTNQYPTSTAAIAALGAADCEPFNLPIYCAVPVNVGSTPHAFDRPVGVYFSLDGISAYILNCGPECGDTSASAQSSVTFLQQSALNVNSYTTGTTPDTNAFTANIPVPGGVTAAVSNGTTLYVSGQQLQPDGLWAGNLTAINLANNTASAPVSISDGTHTKMLFADDNTLWIGSQLCATGERAHQASLGVTTQAANYNCLTSFNMGTSTASVIPAVVSQGATPVPVLYPNTNQNLYYYGDLTGLCWVQGLHKVYTAYGGQVHAFYTGGTITATYDPAIGTTPAAGTEINNFLITVQGTALDVAYMDAVTDAAN
jgi:hypothetical protein